MAAPRGIKMEVKIPNPLEGDPSIYEIRLVRRGGLVIQRLTSVGEPCVTKYLMSVPAGPFQIDVLLDAVTDEEAFGLTAWAMSEGTRIFQEMTSGIAVPVP